MKYILLLLIASTAHAEWHATAGKEVFGPETSEKAACKSAQDRAIENALVKVAGESITVSKVQICNDKNVDACQYAQTSMSQTDGMVTGVRNIKQLVLNGSCTVSLEVDIFKDKSPVDNTFDPDVRLVQNKLYDGDQLNIKAKSNQPMYLNLFLYSPYEDERDQIKLLYPSRYQPSQRITREAYFPSENYKMLVRFPKRNAVVGDLASETIIAVATKTEVTFRESFTLHEFNQRLQEIPKKDRRIIKMPYFVWSVPKKELK